MLARPLSYMTCPLILVVLPRIRWFKSECRYFGLSLSNRTHFESCSWLDLHARGAITEKIPSGTVDLWTRYLATVSLKSSVSICFAAAVAFVFFRCETIPAGSIAFPGSHTVTLHLLHADLILRRGDEPLVVLDTHQDWRFAKNVRVWLRALVCHRLLTCSRSHWLLAQLVCDFTLQHHFGRRKVSI